jgi:predicted DNA-binding WGR domain protein
MKERFFLYSKAEMNATKKFLMNNAWDLFPCQEIWLNGNKFWAYEQNGDVLTVTSGKYGFSNPSGASGTVFVRSGDNKIYMNVHGQEQCDILLYETTETEENLETLMAKKSEEGYECIASQLMV